ncbi:MAG TPA: ACT domain-containing protein [Paludibacter sp.]|nr:ACT domain-containing protein [Paludibacter sp.]
MTIRQLSVFLENKTGHLNQILSVLAKNNINIIALTVADSSDYGIMRAIVSDPEKALAVLRQASFTVRVQEILSIEMNAAPGSMSYIIDLFTAADICIEYVYAFSFGSKSILMLRTGNRQKSNEVINRHGLRVISEEELRK